MAIKKYNLDSPTGLLTLLTLATVIGALHVGKEILLPVFLAALLSFVLAPLVVALERIRVRRVAAVLIITSVAFSLITGIAWLATNQVVNLSTQLPNYKDNLIAKIRSVRSQTTVKLDKAKEAIEDIGEELTEGGDADVEDNDTSPIVARWMPWLNTAPPKDVNDKDRALAVKVVELPPSPLNQVQSWLGPFVAPLTTSGIVVVLVMFMLVKREDLRNRLIQLFGTSRLYATTEAIDDATSRLSRYLRMQFLINTMYGVVIAIGLSLIGIPNAVLWGVFGMLLRFLPYVGPWIAAAMPITLALAVSNGWTSPLLTIALFIVIELLVNNVVEPWLYGASTGVSSFGVIVSALFWTWLWGPIGLVLAMPMTVCLVVVGKYVSQLHFLAVLLGDRETLAPHEQLYQRMLTSNDFEANLLMEECLESRSLMDVYDEIMIPALRLAERDRHAGLLSEQQEAEVIESSHELVDELASCAMSGSSDSEDSRTELSNRRILCIPVRDHADETAALIVEQLTTQRGASAERLTIDRLAGEAITWLEEHPVDAVVLVALPPLGSRKSRYLCKRLRRHDPDLRIIVALFGGQQLRKTQQRLLDSGADVVTTTLPETIKAIRQSHASAIAAQPHWKASVAASTTVDLANERR